MRDNIPRKQQTLQAAWATPALSASRAGRRTRGANMSDREERTSRAKPPYARAPEVNGHEKSVRITFARENFLRIGFEACFFLCNPTTSSLLL